MKDIAEQEVIDIGDMDVEAFNEYANEQGWSDGMPLFVPTEAKVAKFVETVRGDNRRCRRARLSRRCRRWPRTRSWPAARRSTSRW